MLAGYGQPSSQHRHVALASSHVAEAAMLLVVKIDVSALAGTKMRMRAFCGAD